MEFIYNIFGLLLGGISSLFPFLVLITLLVFIHELGHFMVARYYGVRVEVFSIGFGKKILKWQRGDTTYCISLIPLGGYVKMYGEQYGEQLSQEEKNYSFLGKTLWQRSAIALAGPMMNFFLAVFILSGMIWYGEQKIKPIVGDVEKGSKAYEAGFSPGDRILFIQDKVMHTWSDVEKEIFQHPKKELEVKLKKAGEDQVTALTVTPREEKTVGGLGFMEKGGKIEGLGFTTDSTVVGVTQNGVAFLSGFRTFDKIVSVSGSQVSHWREMSEAFQSAFSKDKGWDVVVEREGEGEMRLSLKAPSSYSPEKHNMETLGLHLPHLFIGAVKKGSSADLAGIKQGDLIVKIDGEAVKNWKSVVERIKNYQEEQGLISLQVEREGQLLEPIRLAPDMRTWMDHGEEKKRYMLGIVSGTSQVAFGGTFRMSKNILSAIGLGFLKTLTFCKATAVYIKKLVSGEISRRTLGGVIAIGQMAYRAYTYGVEYFFRMMAILSVQLFLLNLLPVPVLDGGHLVLNFVEWVNKGPLSIKKILIVQHMGVLFIMTLLIFTIYNDIDNWLHIW